MYLQINEVVREIVDERKKENLVCRQIRSGLVRCGRLGHVDGVSPLQRAARSIQRAAREALRKQILEEHRALDGEQQKLHIDLRRSPNHQTTEFLSALHSSGIVSCSLKNLYMYRASSLENGLVEFITWQRAQLTLN